MRHTNPWLFAAALLPLLAIACGNGRGGSPSVTCTDGNIVANEANDYAFSSTITLPPVTVKSMSNLAFDWSQVTQDFLGHTVDPVADLNTIVVMLWQMSLAEFEKELNADSLQTKYLVVSPPPSLMPSAGMTSAMLYDFTINGSSIAPAMFNMDFDPVAFPPATTTYLLAAQTGTNLGTGIRMLQAFQLDDASTNTAVTLTNSSASLMYTADLHSLHPTGVPAGTAAMTLDWGSLDGKTNALGGTFIATNITSAIVGHYTQTPAELETQFLDLQLIATDLYTANIPPGTTLDFTTLADSGGNPFPGVDSTGTWLVGLTCGNCKNPAPWYLTILVPAAQPCK
jgi:hypothetical protein